MTAVLQSQGSGFARCCRESPRFVTVLPLPLSLDHSQPHYRGLSVVLKASTAAFFSTGAAGPLPSREKKHAPRRTRGLLEYALTTHVSFVHHLVFSSSTAGSRQGLPGTRQAHTHSWRQLTAGGPRFHDLTHRPGAHQFDTWVTEPHASKHNRRETAGHVGLATQLNAARGRDGPCQMFSSLKRTRSTQQGERTGRTEGRDSGRGLCKRPQLLAVSTARARKAPMTVWDCRARRPRREWAPGGARLTATAFTGLP